MTETVLVQPNKGFHDSGKVEFNFVSRAFLTESKLYPQYYAIYRKVDGSVLRYDYESVMEYTSHKNRISAQVASKHIGQQRLGCDCPACNPLGV